MRYTYSKTMPQMLAVKEKRERKRRGRMGRALGRSGW